MSGNRWVTRVRALIADADGRVLVLEGEDGCRLPAIELEGTWDELSVVREAIAALTGVEAIVVRSIERSVDEDRSVLDLGLELESTGSSPPASGAAWRAARELASLPLLDRDRTLVERHLSDRPAPERPPWARRGWFPEAAAWIVDTLARHGRSIRGPVEQISSWCISSILRVETDGGRVYFKATARSPLFADEGTVTRGIAELFPGNVPRPIAVDPERRWMLLDDFGPVVGWQADVETRVEVLSTFGRMQLEAASRQDELFALGLLDRRPAWLAAEIASLLESPDALGLEAGEVDDLGTLIPRFVEACDRLADGAVPDSLVHGDLHLSNVARDGGHYVFFDWTDACLTHPFLDLLVVLFEEDPELRDTLLDAYLGVWAEFASEAELVDLWRFAEPLASLNQAVSYRSILGSVERGTAPELEPWTAHWLRRALTAATES